MKIIVLGACGYVGSYLCPFLLSEGHQVVGFDTQYFGDGYWSHSNESAKLIKGDIRDPKAVEEAARGCDVALILACISNDSSYQLNETFAKSINIDAFPGVVRALNAAGVKRVVYASSSSVYGVSHAPEVTEEHELIPMTLYNTSKGICEKILWDLIDPDITAVAIRPATVCGYAPRQRFDLTVNVMTRDAMMKNKITVFGGEQKRPNLHIKDMCDVYKLLLTAPKELINGETFNVGVQNMKVREIAALIRVVVFEQTGKFVDIETQPSTDNRSYHISSEKIKKVLCFEPQHTVKEAILDIVTRFQDGYWKDALTNPIYTNVLQLLDKKVS